jgi:hypothetical protein
MIILLLKILNIFLIKTNKIFNFKKKSFFLYLFEVLKFKKIKYNLKY